MTTIKLDKQKNQILIQNKDNEWKFQPPVRVDMKDLIDVVRESNERKITDEKEKDIIEQVKKDWSLYYDTISRKEEDNEYKDDEIEYEDEKKWFEIWLWFNFLNSVSIWFKYFWKVAILCWIVIFITLWLLKISSNQKVNKENKNVVEAVDLTQEKEESKEKKIEKVTNKIVELEQENNKELEFQQNEREKKLNITNEYEQKIKDLQKEYNTKINKINDWINKSKNKVKQNDAVIEQLKMQRIDLSQVWLKSLVFNLIKDEK